MIRMPDTTANHAHIWRTRSKHQTLAGPLHYQHCVCGLWRIMVVTGAGVVEAARTRSPSATSRRPASRTTVTLHEQQPPIRVDRLSDVVEDRDAALVVPVVDEVVEQVGVGTGREGVEEVATDPWRTRALPRGQSSRDADRHPGRT
jgi:hypothetical protein